MPAFPDLSERLTDGVIELRLASEWDIPDILIAHQDDRELYRRLGLARPPSGAELGRRSEQEPGERDAGTGLRLTIVEPGDADDTCRGQIDVHRVDWELHEAELGIWVAPELRGRGVARGALRLATGWLTGTCGLARLTILTDPDNQPMRRAAAAAGFAVSEQTAERVSLTLTRPLPGPPRA